MWLLLHGFTGSPESWNRVVADAELDQAPLTPTLAGHGRDWHTREVDSLESEIARLVSIASSARQPRLLCGYSMGARVALGLLTRQPQLFAAALLIGVDPGLSDDAARSQRRDADANRARSLRDDGLETFVSAWEKLPLFASQRELPRAVAANQRDIRLGHDGEGLARATEVLGLAEMPDYRPAVAALDVPITLMTGSLDSKFSKIAESLAAENAHVEAEVIDGVGHNVVLEAPAAVVAALKRIEGRVRR